MKIGFIVIELKNHFPMGPDNKFCCHIIAARDENDDAEEHAAAVSMTFNVGHHVASGYGPTAQDAKNVALTEARRIYLAVAAQAGKEGL